MAKTGSAEVECLGCGWSDEFSARKVLGETEFDDEVAVDGEPEKCPECGEGELSVTLHGLGLGGSKGDREDFHADG